PRLRRRGTHLGRPEAQRPPALFLPAAREEELPAGQGLSRLLLHPPPDARPRPPLRHLQGRLRRKLPVPDRVSLAPYVRRRVLGPSDGLFRLVHAPPIRAQQEPEVRDYPHLRRLPVLGYPLQHPVRDLSQPVCRP